MKNLKISSLSILKTGLCIWCFGVALPIHSQTATLLIFGLAWLLSGHHKEKLQRLTSQHRRKIVLFPIIFYLLHLMGLTYSTDFNYAALDLGIKLPLLIVPFMLGTLPEELLHAKHRKDILWSFLGGVITLTLFCFIQALYNIFIKDIPYTQSLFYNHLSPWIHVAYISMYTCLALLVLFFRGKQLFSPQKQWLRYILFIYFILFITFADTRAGVFSLCIVLGGSFIHFLITTKRVLQGFGLLIGLLLIFFTLRTVLPGFGDRSAVAMEYIITKQQVQRTSHAPETEKHQQYQHRLDILTQTGDVITITTRDNTRNFAEALWKEHPVCGVGTGDFKHDLEQKYKDAHIFDYTGENYVNAHQQYFQTGATLGTIGFISLLSVLLLPLIYSIKRRHWTAVLFFLIYTFNLGFESMIERQMGVHILCFAYLIYMFPSKTEEIVTEKA